MASKLIAWGRKIGKSTKAVEIDRGHFSDDPHAKKVHLSDREMDRLVKHLCPGPSAPTPCEFCEEEIHILHAHIAQCRLCRSKMQALLSMDPNGPEDRRLDLLHDEVERLHVSTPPESDVEGLNRLRMVEDLEVKNIFL